MARDTLLIYATAPAQIRPDGVVLDVKFLQGMAQHVALWNGPVQCVLRPSNQPVPFGTLCDPDRLGFALVLLPAGRPLSAHIPPQTVVIAAAADDHEVLGLVPMAQEIGAAVVFSIEYTLATRLRVASMDQSRGMARRIWSMLWNTRQEIRRRAALRAADGLQCNGYPAFASYRALNRQAIMYLDNRMSTSMMATPAEMAARAVRLRSAAPLRLIHSGRLEPMKGAQDLLAVMAALREVQVSATLDIYGTGSLEDQIRAGLPAFGGKVRLHPPVDFVEELVPINRRDADLFLSCHRQSDPSCSYLEAMGCGLPVAGYANRMWQQLQRESGGGIVARMGRPRALAQAIAGWDRDREALVACAQAGLSFAREHDFERVFAQRMAHLQHVHQSMGNGMTAQG